MSKNKRELNPAFSPDIQRKPRLPVDPKKELFLKFVSGQKVLVLDPSSLSRSVLGSLLVSMGVKSADLLLVANHRDAEEEIKKFAPKIVISEFSFGDGKTAFSLFRDQRKAFRANTSSSDCLSIVVTGNRSQMAIAKSAKEDVDLFVEKPFLPEQIRELIYQALELKVRVPAYTAAMKQTQSLIAEGRVELAIQTLQLARAIQPTKAETNFYVETTQLAKGRSKPKQSGTIGYQKDYYKCLIDLYELLLGQKKYADAYRVSQRLLPYFPEDSDRLMQFFRLAIVTKNYADVEKYFDIYLAGDDRSDTLVQFVCSTMIHTAKHYLETKQTVRGLSILQKTSIAASGRPTLLRELILFCVNAGYLEQAQEFMRKFPADIRQNADYLALEYMLADKTRVSGQVIDMGWRLLDQGVRDPLIYQILIKRLVERGKMDPAEHLAWEAIGKWPHQRTNMLSLLRPKSELGIQK